jgi:carboxylesterase type B
MDDIEQLLDISFSNNNAKSSGIYSARREAATEFFNDILSESVFACSSMEFGLSLSKYTPVWFYFFDIDVWHDTPWDRTPTKALSSEGTHLPLSSLGAFHGSEIPFIWNMFPDSHALPGDIANFNTIFNTFTAPAFCPADSFKRTSANQVGCLWVNLIRCGAPQCDTATCIPDQVWPKYSPQRPNILVFDHLGPTHVSELNRVGGRPFEERFLPSLEQCTSWNQRNIPFTDFRDNRLESVFSRMNTHPEPPSGKSASSTSAMIIIVISVMILIT